MATKPNVNSESQKELDKAIAQVDAFDNSIKEMTLDRMSAAPKQEVAPPAIAKADLDKMKETFLKPKRTISSKEKFNEKYRSEYDHAKEYVNFIAENRELIGDNIECWTKPYPGLPAEEWAVPTNKSVWGPRYLAEQIKRKNYHRFVMNNVTTGGDHQGNQYFGSMAVDTTIQRLDAHPVSSRKSIFMGANNF